MNPTELAIANERLNQIAYRLVDNVDDTRLGPVPSASGYESIILFAVGSIILWIIARYGAGILEGIQNSFSGAIETTSAIMASSVTTEFVRSRALALAENPETRDAVFTFFFSGQAG